MKQIFPSSPAMLDKPKRGIPEAKYPWSTLQIGESFPVNPNDIKISSLRPFATRMGKKLGRRFRVIDHGESFEVGRLPLTEEQAIQSSQNIIEVLHKTRPQNIIEALEQEKERNDAK